MYSYCSPLSRVLCFFLAFSLSGVPGVFVFLLFFPTSLFVAPLPLLLLELFLVSFRRHHPGLKFSGALHPLLYFVFFSPTSHHLFPVHPSLCRDWHCFSCPLVLCCLGLHPFWRDTPDWLPPDWLPTQRQRCTSIEEKSKKREAGVKNTREHLVSSSIQPTLPRPLVRSIMPSRVGCFRLPGSQILVREAFSFHPSMYLYPPRPSLSFPDTTWREALTHLSTLSPPRPFPFLSRYHVEKAVCDKVLSALHLHQGKYWDGEEAVPLPEGAWQIGQFSPPFPTVEDMCRESGVDYSRAVKTAVRKVCTAVSCCVVWCGAVRS